MDLADRHEPKWPPIERHSLFLSGTTVKTQLTEEMRKALRAQMNRQPADE